MKKTIENEHLSLSVDAKGRIISLLNKDTKTEIITYPEHSESWRMVIPKDQLALDIPLGSKQDNAEISITEDNGKQLLTVTHNEIKGEKVYPIKVKFYFSIDNGSNEILAWSELENNSQSLINEFECPVIGAFGLIGYKRSKKKLGQLNLVANVASPIPDGFAFFNDILEAYGFPQTGYESFHYHRCYTTCMFEHNKYYGVWMDFYTEKQGLYFGYHTPKHPDFTFKIEKYPKEWHGGIKHYYPKGTDKWLRVYGLNIPRLQPGNKWKSEKFIIMPHKGQWHVGADKYSAYRHETLKVIKPPKWMDNFIGWTSILGKTFTGERGFDYKQCAEHVVKEKKVTDFDMVWYYAHTKLGAEGGDFDNGPSPDLGGETEFRNMINKLHSNGIKIMLLDQFHRWISRDVPEYKELNLEKCSVMDVNGKPIVINWSHDTYLSLKRRETPMSNYVEMCPTSEQWLNIYKNYVTQMIEYGVDGLELDILVDGGNKCYNPTHSHKPGEKMFEYRIEFMRKVREHARKLNPDFIFLGETMMASMCEVFEGYFALSRNMSDNDRIFRYIYPEIRIQTVTTINDAFDSVNRALMFGIGVDTEIWGLRGITYRDDPELARYIGQINRFKRKYPEILINGVYKDTLGAEVKGDVMYSILQGHGNTKALILRNVNNHPVECKANTSYGKENKLTLWSPFKAEKKIKKLPIDLTIKPAQAVVILIK
jgi:hypothetical protein